MKKRLNRRTFVLVFFCILPLLASCQKGDSGQDSSGNLSQKIDNQGHTKEQTENALELKGTAFGELPIVGTEDPIYCNLPENLRDMNAILPLCHDPLYDILYYVNYGEDFMIYAVRDGKSEVAVPFSGKRLFCRQGKLYFLLDTDVDTPIEGAQNGNILSYDPVTGEIHVIVDDVFDTITVYQDCILCAKVEIEGTVVHTESLFYFFDTGKLFAAENYSSSSFILHGVRYRDYFLVKDYDSNPCKMMLCRWDNSETIPLDISPVAYSFYIKGDDLIWFTEEGIHFWNIPSNEERIVEINRKQEGAYSFFYDNYFYTGRGSYIDVESGISQKCYTMFSDGAGSDISEFCTDGERVYGFAATIDDMFSQVFKQHLCGIEWHSMDDLFSIFEGDEEKLFKFSITESSFGPFDGIILLTPVDQLFQ